MTARTHAALKEALLPLRRAMADFDEAPVRSALAALLADGATVRLAHPLGEIDGPDALYERAYRPLLAAFPDLERRDFIVMAGRDQAGADWVGCGGHYMGTFDRPWLDIPPTGHVAAMRFHEFFRFEEGRVVEIQALWDIPELMLAANAWPLSPSLGREWLVPGPASQDGCSAAPRDEAASAATASHVRDMLAAMRRHPLDGGPELMELERFWHPRFNWYGPAGIGSARGVAGFRNWHQIPFLAAMPDRGRHPRGTSSHFFAENAYAAVTGWPNMQQTLSGAGWLGLPPSGRLVTMRSLDFWRLEDGRIRENWVLVDLLDVFRQVGIDVFARLREFNKARGSARFSRETGAALS